MARGFATHRVRKSTGPRRAAAEHVTANRDHRAVREVAESKPQVRMTRSQTQGRWGRCMIANARQRGRPHGRRGVVWRPFVRVQTRGRWDRCTAAELRPHRYGCTIAAGGEACVQSQMRGVEAVYTIAYAGVHLPPRGYRLPCRPHRSLRAGRRTSTHRRLERGIHREAWAPGLRDWEVDAGHRAVHEVANAGLLRSTGANARASGQGAPASTRLPPAMPSAPLTPRGEANLDAQAAGAGYPSRSMGTRATRLGGTRRPQGRARDRKRRAVRAGANAGAQGSQARMHRSSGQDRTCLREASACHAVRTAHSARGGEPRRTGDWGGVPIAKRGAPGLRDWEVDAGPQRSQARIHGHLARAHLPPRGYRLPCRPHCSLRAGRRTSTYRRLGRGTHREAGGTRATRLGGRRRAAEVAGADARASGQSAPASTRLPPAMPSTPLTPRGEANLDVQATGAGSPSRSMGTRATRLGGRRRPQGRARDRKRRAAGVAGANAGPQESQTQMHGHLARAHLPPRGYRLPCRPHCSLRAGRRTSTHRRLGAGSPSRSMGHPGYATGRWTRGHRAVRTATDA